MAVKALKEKQVKRIIRPSSCGSRENLGFLPGDMKETFI
jgi:phosphate starvation-inducible protein PhoH